VVAEISVSDRGLPVVHRLTCAVDCGRVVNPRIVQAQIEGGALFGLAALRQGISIEGGRVSQSNFHDVPLIRMSEAPAVEVHIVESSAAPTGAGEPGTPPAIPAVLNALAAATGKRIRKLPLQGKARSSAPTFLNN